MVNITVLINDLTDYHDSLCKQINTVREEFLNVEGRYYALSEVYEGVAADDFKHHWQRTITNFNEYTEQGEKIAAMLATRINALRVADSRTAL